MSSNKKIEYENLFFAYTVSLQAITTVVTVPLRKLINTHRLDTLLVYAVLLALFIKALPYIQTRISKIELIVLFVYIATWVYSKLFYQQFDSVRSEAIKDIIFNCLLIWFAARMVHLTNQLVSFMRVVGYLYLLRFLVVLLLGSSSTFETYSQYDGYVTFYGFAFLLVSTLLNKKKIDFAGCALLVFFTLMTGARGPFIFEIITFVLGLLFCNSDKKKLRRVIPAILIGGGILASSMQSIMLRLLRTVSFRGGSTRTIQTIINGNFLSSVGNRNRLYSLAMEYISENWFHGLGFVNDRIYLAQHVGTLDEILGTYPHNIFLELGMQFGLVPGVIVILFLIWLFYTTYRRQDNVQKKLFYIILLSIGIFPLLVSGSYLTTPYFYALLGFSFVDKVRLRKSSDS